MGWRPLAETGVVGFDLRGPLIGHGVVFHRRSDASAHAYLRRVDGLPLVGRPASGRRSRDRDVRITLAGNAQRRCFHEPSTWQFPWRVWRRPAVGNLRFL